MKMERRVEIDIMKGIGIILMIVGHWLFIPHSLYHFIYSFHMPLFFIISGYLMKSPYFEGNFRACVKKELRAEYLPYVITAFFCILFTALRGKLPRAIYYCAAFGYGSMGMDFGYGSTWIGTLWFLLALLWAKFGYEIIHNYTRYPVFISILISLISSFAQPISQYVPLCLLQGISAMGFVAIGDCAKQHSDFFRKWWMIALCIIGWAIAIKFGKTDIALVKYKYYSLSLIGGIGGTLFAYYLSLFIKKYLQLSSCTLSWIGKHSLTIFCVYAALAYTKIGDVIYYLLSLINIEASELLISLVLIAVFFIITALIIHIPIINKIFK